MNSNISREDLFIINILNNIYNDNLRQIQSLQNSNNEIRRTISDLLYRNNRQTNNRNNRQANRNFNNSLFPFQNYSSNQDLNLFTQLVNPSSNRSLNNIFNNQTNPSLTNIIDTFFEPITIYPTQIQIENATRNVRFSDIVRPVNNSCPISLEAFQDNDIVTVIRHCGHIFNRNELNAWFRTNCRCPVCRYDIRDYNVNNVNNLAIDSSNNNFVTDSSNNDFNMRNGNSMLNSNDTNNLADITRRIVRQFLNGNTTSETNDLSGNETTNDDNQNRSTEYSVYFTFPYTRN
jgi:Ring finger domain